MRRNALTIKAAAREEFHEEIIGPRNYSAERDSNGLYTQHGLQELWRMYLRGYIAAADKEFTALNVLCSIRHACGDNGLRMQDELVKHIEKITEKATRWDQHQKSQPATFLAGPAEVNMGGVVFQIPEGQCAELRGFDLKTCKPARFAGGNSTAEGQ